MIQRPRLQARLTQRFEAPVTTIIAPAGSGKSTLVELAIDDNRLAPRGRDVLVALRPRDAERTQFLASVARALGLGDGIANDDTWVAEAIHDAIWSAAPDELAVWIDDAHVLDDDAATALRELIRSLPTNGHAVIAARRPLDLGLARLRAQGNVVEFDAADLRLDDDELARLNEELGAGPNGTARPTGNAAPTVASTSESAASNVRHAATAALVATTGLASAGIEFLRDEVVSSLDSERLDRLRRLVALERVDTELARRLTDDDSLDLDELVASLPLVARDGDGIRLHEMLRDALANGMSDAELRKVRSLTGDALADRHDHVGAVDAHLAAGDQVSARAVIEGYVCRAILAQVETETRALLRRLGTFERDTPLYAALESVLLQSRAVWIDELEAWRRVRELAAGRADRIEALALHRIAQYRFLDFDAWDEPDGELLEVYERLVDLGDAVDLAAGAAAHIRSQSAQRDADPDAALAAVPDYEHFHPLDGTILVQQRYVDLGLVERVGHDLTPDDLAGLPTGGEMFVGYAMWLRGEAPPEFAEAMVGAMIDAVGERGQHHVLASTVGTGVPIAIASGDLAAADARVSRLRELDRFELPRSIRLFVALADAILTAARESDEAGAARLREYGRFTTVRNWPMRAHLLALPFVYLSQPERRAALDALRVGPAIARALDVGRALVALREHDDAVPATRLAWTEVNQLRNLALAHHVAELACAADACGHHRAIDVLHQLPDAEGLLRRVADQGAPIAARRAAKLLGDLPQRAPAAIRLRLLGSPEIERGGERDETLGQRSRPAELLALLAIRGAMPRDEATATIWPEHDDEDKAGASLRAALTQAQKLLEPDRSRDAAPYFLRATATELRLHGVETDVDEFERLVASARLADDNGTPRTALAGYREAMERYRGDLLAGNDSGWVVLDRLRLRALAASASCRIAELVGARGDAEDASAWARRALTLEPLSDRAGVVFVKSLVALDDRSNAAAALAVMLDERRQAGVEPSTELLRLRDRLPSV